MGYFTVEKLAINLARADFKLLTYCCALIANLLHENNKPLPRYHPDSKKSPNQVQKYRILADPDPQHCTQVQ